MKIKTSELVGDALIYVVNKLISLDGLDSIAKRRLLYSDVQKAPHYVASKLGAEVNIPDEVVA